MGHFSSNYSHGNKFNVDASDFDFVELSDLIKTKGHTVLKVQGVFTYTVKKKNKLRPCLIADHYKISLPDHLLEDVKKLLNDQEAIDLINDGKCGFKTSQYEDTKNGNGTCYSGTFVDIE